MGNLIGIIMHPEGVFIGKCIPSFQIDRFYWDMGDLTRVSDSTVTYTWHKPGKYNVRLGVTSIADTPEEVQKACSFKEIVVIPREGSITAVREEN